MRRVLLNATALTLLVVPVVTGLSVLAAPPATPSVAGFWTNFVLHRADAIPAAEPFANTNRATPPTCECSQCQGGKDCPGHCNDTSGCIIAKAPITDCGCKYGPCICDPKTCPCPACAAKKVVDPKDYSWVVHPEQGKAALYKGETQVGGYYLKEKAYFPLTSTGWGEQGSPPVPPPAVPLPTYERASLPVQIRSSFGGCSS
jgi:hypothetical protein